MCHSKPVRHAALLLLAAALLPPLSAQSRESKITGFNQELATLTAANRGRIEELSQARLQVLHELIATDPAAAVRLALPRDVRERLGSSTKHLESWGGWTGAVELVAEDDFEHQTSRLHTSISGDGGSLRLYFATGGSKLSPGAMVKAEGLRVGDRIAVVQTATVTAAAPNSCGVAAGLQRMVFLMVNFPSSKIPASLTAAYLQSTISGGGSATLDGYWREASGGLTSASADAFGPFELGTDFNDTQYDQIRDAAITAAASTVTFANYSHIVIIMPPGFPTGGGLGTVGCATLSYPATGTFHSGVIWLRSDFVTPANLAVCATAHENGHNLGLEHASSESFGSIPLGPLSTTSTHDEYGDRYSLMGLCYTLGPTTLLGHYAAPHKVQLGWFGPSNYQNVTASGTFTLKPFESGSSGLQALRVQRGTLNQYLWIEYRQPTGYDATFGSSGFSNQPYQGALIHFEDPTVGQYRGYTRLLNFSAATNPADFTQAALTAGSTWQDPYSTLSLTVDSATAAGLNVAVNYAATLHTPSVVSLAPSNGSGASQPLTFQFSDTSGVADLTVVNVLINSALDGRHGCYLAYAVQSNTLYLIDDAGDGGYAGTLLLNGSGGISNSQCTITGAGSSAASNGGTLTLTLNTTFAASFSGNKVVYMAARDSALSNTGWQTMGVYGVPPLPSPFPGGVSMRPGSGSGASATFTFTYQDATAATNLQTAWALINTAIDGRSGCYVAYYRPGNLLFLYPDNGDGSTATSMVLTGTNTVSNSQCTISAQGSSVLLAGNQMAVSLNISFTSGFSGPKAVWMAAATVGGQVNPWQALGEWRVP